MVPKEYQDQFVDADEYFRLAVSTRRLIRADDHQRDLVGLADPDAGTRFVIHRRHLPVSLPAILDADQPTKTTSAN
ncbi:MAG: hypothetical protein KDA87_10520 [Planctomycetales bacterium]|nr:hypothetical protein [Planctomycetales bacterium]